MRAGGRSCGCFDGRYVDGDEELVAIRCPLHVGADAALGATVRRLDEVRIGRLLPLPPSRVHARVTRARAPARPRRQPLKRISPGHLTG